MLHVSPYIVTALNLSRTYEDVLHLVHVHHVHVSDSSGHVIQDPVKYCEGPDVVLIKLHNHPQSIAETGVGVGRDSY